MPISPDQMARYPGGSIRSKEWQEIRRRIGERSGWKCEVCKAPHMEIVARGRYCGRDAYLVLSTGEVFDAELGLKMGLLKLSGFSAYRVLKIILTVAHLNHDPADNREENLRHLCQRHHLRHDAGYHAINAARTRRRRDGQLDMEDFL